MSANKTHKRIDSSQVGPNPSEQPAGERKSIANDFEGESPDESNGQRQPESSCQTPRPIPRQSSGQVQGQPQGIDLSKLDSNPWASASPTPPANPRPASRGPHRAPEPRPKARYIPPAVCASPSLRPQRDVFPTSSTLPSTSRPAASPTSPPCFRLSPSWITASAHPPVNPLDPALPDSGYYGRRPGPTVYGPNQLSSWGSTARPVLEAREMWNDRLIREQDRRDRCEVMRRLARQSRRVPVGREMAAPGGVTVPAPVAGSRAGDGVVGEGAMNARPREEWRLAGRESEEQRYRENAPSFEEGELGRAVRWVDEVERRDNEVLERVERDVERDLGRQIEGPRRLGCSKKMNGNGVYIITVLMALLVIGLIAFAADAGSKQGGKDGSDDDMVTGAAVPMFVLGRK